MTEYRRTDTHQFVDVELCMVIDKVTGEPERFINNNSIGPFNDALDYIERRSRCGWADRLIIVKLQAIKAFPLLQGGVQ